MIITIRENLQAATICPICREAAPRRCESCGSPWHDDCAFGCPSCAPDIRVQLILETLDVDTYVLELAGITLARLEDGSVVESDNSTVQHCLDIWEPNNPNDTLVQCLRRSSYRYWLPGDKIPSRWYDQCNDLESLYELERHLDIDVIPNASEIEDKLLRNLTTKTSGEIVQVEDGQVTWWGNRDEWDDAIREVILDTAKEYLTAYPDIPDGQWDWYSSACADTECYATDFDTHMSFDLMPGAALEMITDYLVQSYSLQGNLGLELRAYLRKCRESDDPYVMDARDTVAGYLRRVRRGSRA